MFSEESIEVNETPLPGIGLRDDFLTAKGRRIGVISHHNGQRDIVLYAKNDPDACTDTVVLSPGEADTLAEFLGTRRIMKRLSGGEDRVGGSNPHKVLAPAGSTYADKTLGDTQIRSRTGASVVAVLRANDVIASPKPDFGLVGGDQLIVIGTEEGLAGVTELIGT